MSDLFISWSEYHSKIEQLAAKIYHSDWQFNQIVAISRGGLRVGDLLSRIYELPLAVIAVSSYGGAGGKVRGEITFATHLTMTTPKLGSHILLVDDLADSGLSLQQTRNWLYDHHSGDVEEIRSAVIWHKASSVITPDYAVDYLPDNPWIHQPFERYEQLTPAQLGATYEPVCVGDFNPQITSAKEAK